MIGRQTGRRFDAVAGKKFAALAASVLATLAGLAPAGADYLPSIKIGRAALISPADANSYYTAHDDDSHTDQLSKYTHVATPTPPEITELARALRNNVDLIYQYVHNNVQTTWMYGLQKGALGAEIDKSGTPFDQAVLMVALLRQGSNPYSASYVAGTIVLNQQQFSAWTGITRAQAACQLLSSGGIPAVINGETDVTSCDSFEGSVTSVQMAHIWVRVTITGTNYLFDPSFKTVDWKHGIDLGAAMAFGDPLGDATTGGGYSNGTISGVHYVQSLNATALNSDLQEWSANLLTYIKQPDLSGAQLADIVGGTVIIPDYTKPRQTTLPYADPSPPYNSHVWAADQEPSGYNTIPDQYRTFITIDGKATQYDQETGVPSYKPMFLDEDNNLPKLFADEIYGRRLTIETNFNVQGIATQTDYYFQRACLALDAGQATTWNEDERPGWCLGPLHYDYQISWPTDYHKVEARSLPTHITLTANHPYAADADGSATTGGDYMDTSIDKKVVLITPLTIVHGWGDVSPTLFNKWAGERAADSIIPPLLQNPQCGQEEYCPQFYVQPTGNFAREKLASNWLAQFTRAGELNAAIANSVLQIHHAMGFVYGDSSMMGYSILPNEPPSFTIGDNFDRIDVDAGISMTHRLSYPIARRAALLAFAAEAAAMEGGAGAQFADVPDTASTATRFEWGNKPDPNHSEFSQNPYNLGPQKFLQFDLGNYENALSLIQVDGHTAGSCNNPLGQDPWNAPPTLTPNQCYGSGMDHCIHEVGGGVFGIACHVADEIGSYAQAGFRVVASQEAFLGPGQRGGMIIPQTYPNGVPYIY
ncbi:MAG: hypothetical protein JO056_01210 [Alphaproteobacteria bacterium]|nr:hypothetical protein [Alphaproteobacteria bacterium]